MSEAWVVALGCVAVVAVVLVASVTVLLLARRGRRIRVGGKGFFLDWER